MHNSANYQARPTAVDVRWYCDKVYHKQGVCFLLYFLGQIVTWQSNHNLLPYGLKLTMYCYKCSWLTLVELSIYLPRPKLTNTVVVTTDVWQIKQELISLTLDISISPAHLIEYDMNQRQKENESNEDMYTILKHSFFVGWSRTNSYIP